MALHISRRNSITVALGLLAVFFIGSLLLIKKPAAPVTTTAEVKTQEILPTAVPSQNVSFVLSQFHRAEMKNGKKLWEVEALRGLLDPQTNIATLEQASVFIYRDDQTTIHVTAPTAHITIKGASLTDIDAIGGVKLFYNNDYVVETEHVIMHRTPEAAGSEPEAKEDSQGTVEAPGNITITGSQLSITGVGFFGDLSKRQFTIKNSVKSIFYPKNKQT
jgi:LPS export ABC transporter protein LptC